MSVSPEKTIAVVLAGGFGSAVLECIAKSGLAGIRVRLLGIDDVFVEHGTQKLLRRKYGLDKEGIFQAAVALSESDNRN